MLFIWRSRISKGAPVICQSCKEEDSVTDESLLKEEEVRTNCSILDVSYYKVAFENSSENVR